MAVIENPLWIPSFNYYVWTHHWTISRATWITAMHLLSLSAISHLSYILHIIAVYEFYAKEQQASTVAFAIYGTSWAKGFPDIRTSYRMCVLVHLATSWTGITISLVSWYPIPLSLTHFLVQFCYYLRNMVRVQSKKNKTRQAIYV
jgi:hypothetical protein